MPMKLTLQLEGVLQDWLEQVNSRARSQSQTRTIQAISTSQTRLVILGGSSIPLALSVQEKDLD